MNNIRHEQTNYNPKKDPGSWENSMWFDDATANRKLDDAERRVKVWKDQLNKPDLKPYEREELLLNLRIAGCTEGDTLAKRVEQKQKELKAQHEVSKVYAEKTREGSQTEDEFKAEQSKWMGGYRKTVEAAKKHQGLL